MVNPRLLSRLFLALVPFVLGVACAFFPEDESTARRDPNMPVNLAAESPLIWPSPIAVPADSDSPLASGQLRNTLKQLADRTDHLDARRYLKNAYQVDFATNALIATRTAPSAVWLNVTAVQVLANVKAGDLVKIAASYVLKSAGAGDVRARLRYDATAIASTTQVCTGSELVLHFSYMGVAPADNASVPISIEILPDGADDATLNGFGYTSVEVYHLGH